MRSLLGCVTFSVFSFSYLAAGTSLECEFCNDVGRNCTGVMKTCAAEEDTCIISLKQFFLSSITATFIGKDCGLSSECSLGITELDIGNGLGMRLNRVCCTGDGCKNVSAPVLPPPDTKPNGFRCPTCSAIFSTECDASPVACTGSSTQCIELAGQLSYPQWNMNVAIKGCANDAACHNLKAGFYTVGGESANMSVAKCTAAFGASKTAL